VKYSLVIPCYNEEKNLEPLLIRCLDLAARGDIEIILVNNGSTDNSEQILQQLLPNFPNCRMVSIEQNQGYGFGILSGLREAKGDILAWMHGDLQTDPNDLIQGIRLFEKHGDNIFVKGRRYGRPIADVIFTFGMSLFETIFLRKTFWDINAQPTMFSKDFFNSWANPPNDFSLDLYAYYMGKVKDLKVIRFPVNFGDRLHGTSHWNVNWAAKYKFIIRTIEFSLKLRKELRAG